MRRFRRNSTSLFEGLLVVVVVAFMVVLGIVITAAPFLLVIWFVKEIGLF